LSISRSFSIVDIPSPQKINAKFVYNFFTPDERTNSSGKAALRGGSFKNQNDNGNLVQFLDEKINSLDPRSEKRKELQGIIQSEIPRYIDLDFSRVTIPGSNLENDKKNSGDLLKNVREVKNSEETITTSGFASLKESDDDSQERLKSKLFALSNAAKIKFSDLEQSKKLSLLTSLPQIDIQSLITPLNDPSVLLVNSKIIKNSSKSKFETSAMTKIHGQINKRYADIACLGADDTSPLSRIDTLEILKKVSENHKSKSKQFSLSVNDHIPSIDVFDNIKVLTRGESEKIVNVSVVGYRIGRHLYNEDGSTSETKYFIQVGVDNTTFKDSKILYGASYSYDVSTIVKIDAIVRAKIDGSTSSDSQDDKSYEVSFYVVSSPSSSERVVAEEYQAPNHPDGVFYNFNYDSEKGLKIRWQIPSGKSRDVKYFQVFRRKNIFEPFSCLCQIGFDDSEVKTVHPESVRSDKIITSPNVMTYFEDTKFERTSKWIYAIVAIDAHGLSSGYSTQTEVSFDKPKNSLILKMISRGGAPKQYPNFYVDPKLDDNFYIDSFSQDAILDSNHTKMTIYFSPDAKIASCKDGRTEDIYVTKNQNGKYMFHFINTDLQKANMSTVTIDDKTM
jgi:hypothetical protein